MSTSSKKTKIILLGSGELGKEFIISAQRLGLYTIAVDKYAGAPAMQVADASEVINMLDGRALDQLIRKHKPDYIVPEIEAIRTEKLVEFEKRGFTVIPSAKAAHLTMNRDAIRDYAAKKLKLRTAQFAYATSQEELFQQTEKIGYPCVVKPVMSSSGKGQSVVKNRASLAQAWDFAVQGMRGDKTKVIVEEFIHFEYEITLLTVKQRKGPTLFVDPIGHRQERGDYQESWLPAKMKPALLKKAQKMAKSITDALGGAGLFGVEFFVTRDDVYFSELSPRPHDTGMVTMISQDLNEFDLHLRAILGYPIPEINYYGPSASAVILSNIKNKKFKMVGIEKALQVKGAQVRIFGKPEATPYRRMGVALARGKSTNEARKKANQAARQIQVK
ncbi:MAG: formate-dependent phosphoribosylglycinamide formyltransferase [Bdellovibrionales bacterium]|nr:formate-dependent phosphoribosylglycinamide formyltransferase [Bdellovibrionales bacterium]